MFGASRATGSWQLFCGHNEDACDCLLKPGPKGITERLEEMEFARSACAAAQSGDVAKLQRILSRDPSAVHSDGTAGRSGYTPLHYAARAGHLQAVQLLLQHGAHVDAATTAGQATPLHRAAAQGHLPVVETLLSAGADVCCQDSDGESALHKAAAAGHTEVCRALLRQASSAAQLKDRRSRTPADRAAGTPAAAAFFGGATAG